MIDYIEIKCSNLIDKIDYIEIKFLIKWKASYVLKKMNWNFVGDICNM